LHDPNFYQTVWCLFWNFGSFFYSLFLFKISFSSEVKICASIELQMNTKSEIAKMKIIFQRGIKMHSCIEEGKSVVANLFTWRDWGHQQIRPLHILAFYLIFMISIFLKVKCDTCLFLSIITLINNIMCVNFMDWLKCWPLLALSTLDNELFLWWLCIRWPHFMKLVSLIQNTRCLLVTWNNKSIINHNCLSLVTWAFFFLV